jgi:predicted nucleic acid-binding protein
MTDLVLDVGALADLLAQCFQSDNWTTPRVQPSQFISRENSRQINRIVWEYRPYVVIASAMAFVELARKWNEIVAGRFQPYQMATFLQDTPDWFVVEPVDEYLVLLLGQVPLVQELEWPDATHVATVLSRERGDLITTDRRLECAVELLTGN